jgi:hypothetical protein
MSVEAIDGLRRGDFSRLAPLFDRDPSRGQHECPIMQWYEAGLFGAEPSALAEAFTCACFNGRTEVARQLLAEGVDPVAGDGTGLNAFHWAVNRGHLETVKLLVERKLPLEQRNMYGGTVLGTAVWSAVNEPREGHVAIIEALIGAGAKLGEAGYPSGNERVDKVLRHHGAGA